MNDFFNNLKGPEWAKYVKAAIMIYRNEVLPYINRGLEKNEEYAFTIAAMGLGKAKFSLTEGIKKFSAMPSNAIIFNSRYIILPRFVLLMNNLIKEAKNADEKKEQACGIRFEVKEIDKMINLIEMDVDSVLT